MNKYVLNGKVIRAKSIDEVLRKNKLKPWDPNNRKLVKKYTYSKYWVKNKDKYYSKKKLK